MEIKDVKKTETKSVSMSLRTYPSYAKWMKENNVSPNAVLDKALKELMKKE